MDETSHSTSVSRNFCQKSLGGSPTDGVSLQRYTDSCLFQPQTWAQSLHGSDLSGGPPPFPSQGDSSRSKASIQMGPTICGNPPWSFDVRQRLVPHSPFVPNICLVSGSALHRSAWKMHPALPTPSPESDAGVSGHLRPCTVEEPLAGRVSLDLNALVPHEVWPTDLPSPHQAVLTPELADGWVASALKSFPSAQPSSCLLQKMLRALPPRLQAGQSMAPPRPSTSGILCVHTATTRHQFLVL